RSSDLRVHLPDQFGRMGLHEDLITDREPVGQACPSPGDGFVVDQPQTVLPKWVKHVEVLAPDPGQFTDARITVDQLRTQHGHPLGQVLHQPKFVRTEFSHTGTLAKPSALVERFSPGAVLLKSPLKFPTQDRKICPLRACSGYGPNG